MLGAQASIAEQSGLFFKSIKDIFAFKEKNKGERDISIWVSYMELYNEQINDLLDKSNVNLKLREDKVQGYYVCGLKVLKLEKPEEFR